MWRPISPYRPVTLNGPPGWLVESGRESLRRGALATAVDTLRRASALTREDRVRRGANELLVEALALAGRMDECISAGADLLRASPAATPQTQVQAHLAIAHAAVEATRWPIAASHLASAERLLAAYPDPALTQRWRVLAAEAALAARDMAGRGATRRVGAAVCLRPRPTCGVTRSGCSGGAIGRTTSMRLVRRSRKHSHVRRWRTSRCGGFAPARARHDRTVRASRRRPARAGPADGRGAGRAEHDGGPRHPARRGLSLSFRPRIWRAARRLSARRGGTSPPHPASRHGPGVSRRVERATPRR